MEYSEGELRMSIGIYFMKPEKCNIQNNIILQSTLSLRYTPEINTTC